MKSKWAVALIIIILIIIGCWTKIFSDVRAEIRHRDPEIMAQEIEDALNEVNPGWEKTAITKDIPVTFSDDDGNTIIYHCLATTRYGNENEEITGVDTNVIGGVIDIEYADSIRECMVNEVPAILCEQNDRAYLCWSLSDQYSFVIEYTPDAVSEQEIFRMAEELRLP